MEKIINYIVGVIYDASHINADNKTILKIIDMMLSSAIQLSDINKKKSTIMEKYRIFTSQCNEMINTESTDETVLHEDILDILFKYKNQIYRKLIDLKGTFLRFSYCILQDLIYSPKNQTFNIIR